MGERFPYWNSPLSFLGLDITLKRFTEMRDREHTLLQNAPLRFVAYKAI